MAEASISTDKLEVHLIAMVRNDGDVASAFLAQAAELFDKTFLLDVQSTDGTSEAIQSFAQINDRIHHYTTDREEKYQSAAMNLLARESFAQGASWVFFLDTDEFLEIEGKAKFKELLASFPAPVMSMPWINLVPTQYGTFDNFSLAQDFYWNGRVSKFNKIAISAKYAAANPLFHVHEGNHSVSSSTHSQPAETGYGLSLLHVPIRSLDRLKYKIDKAYSTLMAKHNRQRGEGHHVIELNDMLARGGLNHGHLNALASQYSDHSDLIKTVEPQNHKWPVKKFPPYLLNQNHKSPVVYDLATTTDKDGRLTWNQSKFVKGSSIMAVRRGQTISFVPRPENGHRLLASTTLKSLTASNKSLPLNVDGSLITEAISASFITAEADIDSAWSEFTPALFAIFAILKPRRYVDVGSHSGMTYFAACQASRFLKIESQCIAVGSWSSEIRDATSGSEAFATFKKILARKYPEQIYIRGTLTDSASCFETQSIDLLHLDGLQTYEEAKATFEIWLPKLSDDGVIIFHNTNKFEAGFAVWRLWDELKERYPSVGLANSKGFGVLFVGKPTSVVHRIFELVTKSPHHVFMLQTYLQGLRKLAVLNEKFYFEQKPSNPDFIAVPENNENSALLTWQRFAKFSFLEGLAHSSSIGRIKAIIKRFAYSWFSPRLLLRLVNRKGYQIIKNSGMFDEEFYLQTYPDVQNVDPLKHYLNNGVFQLRNPSREFNTSVYLLDNWDVLISGENPLVHYALHGKSENRKCHPLDE
jgi:hypothetical protein